jgi:hypothetical protein
MIITSPYPSSNQERNTATTNLSASDAFDISPHPTSPRLRRIFDWREENQTANYNNLT